MRLTTSGDIETQRMVAKCPNATEEALAHLARHTDKTVRLHVARRFDTPLRVLRRLARGENDSVRLRARVTLRLHPATKT